MQWVPQQSQSPAGQLLFHQETDEHEVDVVVLGMTFSAMSDVAVGGVVTDLTLVTTLILPNGESQVVLQRFSATGRPSAIELDQETLALLNRETGIMLEKRIRTSRATRRTR